MLMGLETEEPCRLPVPSSSQRAPPQFELSHGSKDAEEMPHEGFRVRRRQDKDAHLPRCSEVHSFFLRFYVCV